MSEVRRARWDAPRGTPRVKDKMQPPGYRDISDAAQPRVALAGGGQVAADGVFAAPLAATRNAFAYRYEGSVSIGGQALPEHAVGVLGPGETVRVVAGASGARLLIIAGRPIGEPIVQHGPFVMNTKAEIEAAMRDYRTGALTAA